MRKITLAIGLIMSVMASAQQTFTTGMNAAYTIAVTGAVGSSTSSQGMFAAQDQGTSTMIWYELPVLGTEPPDVTITGNPVGGLAWSPDGNKLIISENGLTKIYDTIPTINNQTPDVTLNVGNGGVAVSPDGRLVIADINADVIYIWNTIPTVTNTPPDLIYGGLGTANNRFNFPWGVNFSPTGKLLVAELSNHRIMIFDSIPVSTADTATVVVGQPNFTSNASGLSATSLNQPLGATVTVDGKLAISEFSNHRVMVWNSVPDTNGAAADVVLGQPNFTTNTSGTALNQMTGPYNVSTDFVGRLFVSGRDMNRVQVFGVVPSDTVDLALSASSNADKVCNNASITFNFSVTNNGPDTAKNVTVIADLPAQLDISSASTTMGTYNTNSGFWQFNQLLNGATATLTVIGTIDTIAGPDTLIATSNIQQADGVDTNFTNNTFTTTIYLDTISAPAAPNAGNKTICEGETATLNATVSDTNAVINWYAGASTSATLKTGNSYTTPALNNSTTYYVEADNGCVSARVAVNVTVEVCDPVDPIDPVDNIIGKLTQNVKVYPNPATDILNIELSGDVTASQIAIVNMLGEQIKVEDVRGDNLLTVDVSNLQSGIYFVVVDNHNTYKITVK